ncbi:hypothetical protein [Dyella choica]|uniref:Lipoprotein n=1 Tax=Dyella choica TaxID=1927959 RepID=A0A3S0RIJ9_9GAMM|nr:hypothetical protein [Dyella choica]RUL72202.1 hypothetical protein EKH80_17925 [Dyella choica]
MKRYFAVLLMLACTGCAPVKVNVPDIAKSDSLQVADMRPSSEKEKKLFSLLITSSEYGIIRMGDGKLSPPPVRLLQYQAFQKFSTANPLPKVTVNHFVIYVNAKSQLRSGAVGAGVGGMVGAMIGNSIANHDTSSMTRVIDENAFDVSEEYRRGFYTSSENPDRASVFVIYLDTDIDGKNVFTRTVASMQKHGDEDPLSNAVQLAIRNHLDHYGNSVAAMAPNASAAVTDSPGSAVASPASTPAPSVAATSVIASTGSQESAATAAIEPVAQSVASQVGCGAVQANGATTFVAPCGTYSIVIDCDGGQCRPMHTIAAKHDE